MDIHGSIGKSLEELDIGALCFRAAYQGVVGIFQLLEGLKASRLLGLDNNCIVVTRSVYVFPRGFLLVDT